MPKTHLCHHFGRRRFATHAGSRMLAWRALSTMGEAWHNDHHASPASAAHGLRDLRGVWRERPARRPVPTS